MFRKGFALQKSKFKRKRLMRKCGSKHFRPSKSSGFRHYVVNDVVSKKPSEGLTKKGSAIAEDLGYVVDVDENGYFCLKFNPKPWAFFGDLRSLFNLKSGTNGGSSGRKRPKMVVRSLRPEDPPFVPVFAFFQRENRNNVL